MTALIQAIQQRNSNRGLRFDPSTRRASVVALFSVAVVSVPDGLEIATQALADAYLAVSVFVAGTIALLLVVERGFGFDLTHWLNRHQRWHVPAGILLGSFPGCGGAIIAVTQFTRGHLSFGGVVATLVATMGDAMFLLLAQAPVTALTVLSVSAVMGLLSGYAVDALHGPEYLRPARTPGVAAAQAASWKPGAWRIRERIWVALMVPGILLGILGAFQIDVDDAVPGSPGLIIGVVGALLSLWMWVGEGAESPACQDATCGAKATPLQRVVNDTNFVSSWVIFAFIGYELLIAGLGVDVADALSIWGPLLPAVAILVGFVPGCGPQIVVTSLHLSGTLPFSAQLGNAIANDGDALFPALAVAPKAALVATLYSAIPAFIAAYAWFLLFE
ncbi:MAG: putative manganese transporter [Candidatus Thiodiazotropha sp.]